jgi:hypothetical protein
MSGNRQISVYMEGLTEKLEEKYTCLKYRKQVKIAYSHLLMFTRSGSSL